MIATPVTADTVITEGTLVHVRGRRDSWFPNQTLILARVHVRNGVYHLMTANTGEDPSVMYGGAYARYVDAKRGLVRVWRTGVAVGSRETDGCPMVSNRLKLVNIVTEGTLLPCGYLLEEDET